MPKKDVDVKIDWTFDSKDFYTKSSKTIPVINYDVIRRIQFCDEPKSKIVLEDRLFYYTSKRFNWFKKRVIKFLFGFDIEDMRGGSEND